LSLVLDLRAVTRSFGGAPAVDRLSLSAAPGEFLVLLGPSGCGKTTTLRLIAGFEMPDAGQILINGHPVAGNGHAVPPERRRVGMVFQEYALFPHLNVEQNIAFGLSGDKPARRARAAALMTMVGLSGLGERMPYALSGGQQQRVALARALAPQPEIVLLDEPFSNLDAALRGQVRREVREILRQSGAACVFVTHDQEEALSLADRVAVMFGGRIAQAGTPQEIYERPASRAVAEFIGEAALIPGQAAGLQAHCALGEVALARPAHGPSLLLLRPESVALASPREGAAGRVLWCEYFGREVRASVQLEGGPAIPLRLNPWEAVSAGALVHLRAAQPLHTLPAE
jgi:iron(III) transport system ATP-binding protein